eukprot:m51a1_g4399 hypothetical protein (437) ;mRNA; f:387298-389234
MKLEMQDMAGRCFYVFKPWNTRQSDPDSFHAAKATENGRVYTTTSLRRLESLGAIIRAPPFAHGVVLVAKDAPDMLGGRAQGFWKLIQKRLRVKHASSSVDPHLIPELEDLRAWLAEIRTGPVEAVPQLRASATLFPWSDEVRVSVKPEETTSVLTSVKPEDTTPVATQHGVVSMAAVAQPWLASLPDRVIEAAVVTEPLSSQGEGPEASDWDWGSETTRPDDWPRAAALREASGPGGAVPAVVGYGVHPWHAHLVQPPGAPAPAQWLADLRGALEGDPAAVVGEIGLDRAARAPETGECEPVSLHCVRAWGEMVEHITAAGASAASLPRSLSLHSFGGSADTARQLLRSRAAQLCPLFFGFSSAINLRPGLAARLRGSLEAVPRESVLVESDLESPAAAVRGVRAVVAAVAGVWGCTVDEAAALTAANAQRFLGL